MAVKEKKVWVDYQEALNEIDKAINYIMKDKMLELALWWVVKKVLSKLEHYKRNIELRVRLNGYRKEKEYEKWYFMNMAKTLSTD